MVEVASFIPDFLPFGAPDDPAPLTTNLPTYRTQLANQYRNAALRTLLSNYPEITDAYRNLQSQRVNVKGSAPYSAPIISRGIKAAGTGEAVTPEPEGNIVQNFTGDVASIASILNPLNLAKGVASEIAALPNLGTELAAGLSKARTPLESIGAIAQAPGVRFIPGSYLLGTLAPGGPGLASGIYEHPLYSALDVLPYASKAAKATPVVKAATSARTAAIDLANKFPEAGLAAPTSRIAPIRTFVENYRPGTPEGYVLNTQPLAPLLKLDQQVLEPNVIGRATQRFGQAVRGNPLLSNVFDSSNPVRKLARILSRGDAQTSQLSDVKRGAAEQTAFTIRRWLDDNPDILNLSIDERRSIYHHLQRPDQAPLPDHLRPFADDLTAKFNDLGRAGVELGTLAEVPMLRGPELFPRAIADKLNNAQATVRANVDLLDSAYREFDTPPPDTILTPHPGTLDAVTPALSSFRANVESANWQGALADLQAIEATTKLPNIDYAAIRKSIAGDGGVIDLERFHTPARWQPLIEETLKANVADALETGKVSGRAADLLGDSRIPTGTLTVAEALDVTRSGILAWLPEDLRNAFTADARRTLHDTMANADALPVYVPHATLDQARRSISAPAIFDHAPPVSAWKERKLAQSPGVVEDPYLLLGHNAQQLVNRGVQERVGQYIANNFGVRLGDIRDQYLTSTSRSLLDDPTGLTDAQSNIVSAILKDYEAFDPAAWVDPSLRAKGLNLDPDTILIPKQISRALDDFSSPKRGALGAAFDPIMKVFRHSVLTLSPRFYINNIMGGAIFTALDARNPATIAQHFKDAWHLAKDPEALVKLRDGTLLRRADIGQLPPAQSRAQGLTEYALELKSKPDILAAYQQFESSKALRKVWDKIEGSAVRFNTLNDQFWQAANFLEGRQNALNKGLTETQAIHAGVEAGRRVFETWDTLTPLERTIIKSIFPFYGFTRNLLRYTLQYPTNHPTRLAILSSIAKAEEEDFGSGLPRRFASAFWLGSPDDKGRVTTINIGGANPFQDVASYASLLGFLTGAGGDFSAITRNVNPGISTALKSMGIDTSAGASDLYPDMDINPVTGEASAVTSGNPLVTLATSIVPQSSILANLTGINAEFKALLKSNPDAAGRTLLAAAGVPGYVRSVDVPTERMKAEISRFTTSRTIRNEALKSGDWSKAEAWESLRPYLDAVRAKSPAERAPFTLTDDSSLGRALLAGATGRR